ncbi:anthranilate synthase component I family protein [Patescibacteria group bacterium]|nr:anthranilate synthase component I family protein [Patescibacteria group bacterium]MBU1016196.1 anthranilate synthase component I family protein [Patescibacteria group bacterium]MBU1684687.1 anthranilate synthase component I family protein [Patescibacteria group bacterium]MBU1938938.1 anthranilate synthase component I family protein [Patescibacteria group bacterium]
MSHFDLNQYSEDSKKEGFCMLHTGGTEQKWTKVCRHPTGIFTNLPESKYRQSVHIGFLAYPNPKLKNQIPASRFYCFRHAVVHNHGEKLSLKPFNPEYGTSGKLEQSISKAEYVKKIRKVKGLLADGEIYQINYAIRFRKKFSGNPYHLFLRLIESNPTNFSAFLNCGDFQILSNSPERLFRVEKNVILTQPIKGTIAKSKNSKPETQKKALEKLLASEKERAELDMITDLERNDVGKICKYGTLRLTKERGVMELPNLYHTYSEVRGDLPRGTTRSEIINAMFPGGSVTGCPKKRAMEYIEKFEGMPRNIFTGSIIHIADGVMDSNICIRTALVRKGYIEYWAGGGIVADSDPEAEYAECLLKAEKFLGIL